MPMKKKKKGKKSSSTEGDGSTGKKKKMTKAERDLAKIVKDAEVLHVSGEPFLQLIDRMERWLNINCQKAVNLFTQYDSEGNGVVSYDEFKSGMFDLNAPCNAVELHLLTKLLDKEHEDQVDYMELKDGFTFAREAMENVADLNLEQEPTLMRTERSVPRCICCQIQIWEPYKEKQPKYIELLMRLATFENCKQHPGHFNQVVHSHMPIYGLIQIIREQAKIESNNLAIFTDKTRSRDAMLPASMTLEECGFHGGTYDHPEELLLYYDYKVEFTDCPILLCDHYFGGKK